MESTKELTKQELKAIIGLEIPTDLAFLYNMENGLPALHSDRQISSLTSKIFTQTLGLKVPSDINNYIFTNFTESHFQQHLFVAKREPISHPFLIKTKEHEYKQAVSLFKLVLRFMYDANMSEQREVLLGNYIIQQVLSSRALSDELLIQICVQMWARHQSDVSRRKIAHLMSMCLSVLPPTPEFYKYLLKFTSDHAFDGFKMVCQHKLLQCYSVDYPTPRYYPPSLVEWLSARKQAKMALAVSLPRGKVVNCHVDSWSTGEDCARLALCACGLFDNRHGWTVQLHDDNAIYEVAGSDHVLDLIGEIEVPPGVPHTVAPFLVSVGDSTNSKLKPSKHSRDRPHRPDINRQPSFEMSESMLSFQSGQSSSISSIRDNLRIVPKPDSIQREGPIDVPPPPPPPPDYSVVPQANGRSSQVVPPPAIQVGGSANSMQAPQIRGHSKLNERPLVVDLPGMSRDSLLNSRYRENEAITTPYTANGKPGQHIVPAIVLEGPNGIELRKPPSVTFKDQVTHPISDSHMNDRYSVKPDIAPLKALSTKANLNSRYIEQKSQPNQVPNASKKTETYQTAVLGTPRYPAPSPLASSHSSEPSESSSKHTLLASPSLSVQEAPKTHQDIMLEINQEIQGISDKRHRKRANHVELQHLNDGNLSSENLVAHNPRRVQSVSTADMSDLDDWVDKVFDPIIHEDKLNTLTNPVGLKQSLKGNGDSLNTEANDWVVRLAGADAQFASLQSTQDMKLCLKGEGEQTSTAGDSNNNNATTRDQQTSSQSGSSKIDEMSVLQAQLQSATLQNQLLQQTIDNAKLSEQLKNLTPESNTSGNINMVAGRDIEAHIALPEGDGTATSSSMPSHASLSTSGSVLSVRQSTISSEQITSLPPYAASTPAKPLAQAKDDTQTELASVLPASRPQKKSTHITHIPSSLLDKNPAYSSSRYQARIFTTDLDVAIDDNHTGGSTSVKLTSPTKTTSPQQLSGAIPAPKKVGKVVWPPVKAESPRVEKQIGKLLIEEAQAQKVQQTLGLNGRRAAADLSPTHVQKQNAPAKTLTERLELLEKKIGERPPPSNDVVVKLLSPASPPPTPVVVKHAPSLPPSPVTPDTPMEPPPAPTPPPKSSPAVPVPSPKKNPLPVAVEVLVDDEVSKVSDRLPVKGVFQLLSSVRTETHADSDVKTYLTYSEVPWWLSIRKEIFFPNETLSNPKTIDHIFFQIVRDAHQYPCLRMSGLNREEARKLLGNINVQNMTDESISGDLKWRTIVLARSWSFYFARIFMVTGEKVSDIQLLAVRHDGILLGKRSTDSHGKEGLVQTRHILYDDISEVKVPKEGVFQLTAEHKTYKVFTIKAGAIANLVNACGIEAMKGGDYVEATSDYITCDPGHLSYKRGDVIKLKPDKMTSVLTSLPPAREGWLYGSLNGSMGSFPEDTTRPIAKRELSRTGSFQDSRSRHSSGLSDGEQSQTTGKYSMLEFSMMYFRENLDRYSTKPNEMGIHSNIRLIESLKLSGLKRRKSLSRPKDSEKLQRQESWSWKEQADMIKWTKTAIPASLLKLPTEQMNKIAVDCFYSIQQFMGDQDLDAPQTDIDCAFRLLKACHQCPELKDEIYCQLARQTTNNKSPQSQSCLRGWRLFTLVACWFSPSDILKPFLLNYLQQNASDPSRPYHSPAHNCLQMLRKTIKYGGRKNVPSVEEIAAITDGKLGKRQSVLVSGGFPFILNISPSTVVQDVIDEICAKLGVVSQMEQDEYTVFAMVETDNEYARLKREEYVMDVVTEMRLQRKDCALIFERTSWYFPLRLESATYEYLDMMFNQCIPDYIDGYLLTMDHKNKIPPKQLDDIVTIAALLHRAAGHDQSPQSLKEVENCLPGPILSLGLLRHSHFLNGIQGKLARLVDFNSVDCKIEALSMLRKWPLFGASFFNIQCLTEPKISGECLLAVNRAGIHFLHHKTHKVILSYPFTEVISSRKISSDHKITDEQFLDIKVGNNLVQKVVRVETAQGGDIAHLIGQYIKAVNSSAKLSS